MVFEVSTAKKEILEKLAEQDWTPTDLAEELDITRQSVYNHLNNLHEQGVLQKSKVEAKTRPKTLYSIGDGFIQFIAVLPGQFTEQTVDLSYRKEAMFRIWSIPQEEFHPFLEDYWHILLTSSDIEFSKIEAVAVYGSVARGTADEDSDIDILLITEDEEASETAAQWFGSTRINTEYGSKICMAEVYSRKDYRNGIVHESQFLEEIRDELQIIYDPQDMLLQPEKLVE